MSSNNNAKIGFIGGGNMAQAIIKGLLQAGHSAKNIRVSDPSAEQLAAITMLEPALGTGSDNAALAAECDALVLAVKPQIMPAIAAVLGELPRPDGQVIVSVAAGITLRSFGNWFGNDAAVVRVMPNQPALVGAGMSGLCATAAVGTAGRELADYLMRATGQAVWFEDEMLMDAVTAISGSGPAYFYLIMEIMQEVAVEVGFDAATARNLATQTALGAASVASQTPDELALLRERVTSPGGTTAAALNSLEESGIRDIFRTALQAARDRSVELGKISDDT
jgi:pyrroline-5-carboxylate reductase